MHNILQFLLMGGALVCGTSVLIVYMGIQYSSRKRGLTKGATSRDLADIRQRLDALGSDIHTMQETMADLTLMLGDATRDRLSGDGS